MSRSFTTHGTTRTIGIGREIVRDRASGIGVGDRESGSGFRVRPFFLDPDLDLVGRNPNNCSGSSGPDPARIPAELASFF